jgi:signal transduction histidine kinase/DNA-binding response OmpR family regulator
MYSGPRRRIEADEFVLRDAKGAMRAALTMTADGPGLFLYDQTEVIRAGLLVGKEEPGLALFDRSGKPQVSLALSGEEPKLLLRDVEGVPRAALTVSEAGTRLMLSDAQSGPRVGFAAENGEVSLVFADPIGKPRILLGMPGGVPGLTLLDNIGRRRARLEIEDNTSTFELYDSDGTTSSSSTVAWVEPRPAAAALEAKLALEATARQQLEEALAASEERLSAITAAKTQMEEAQRASEEKHSAEQQRLEEALQASEVRLSAATAAKTQGEQMQRASQEAHSAERERLEVALQASEAHLSAMTAAKAQMEDAQRATETTYCAERKRLGEALRASEDCLRAMTAAKAKIEETQRASEKAHFVERMRLEESLRASEDRLRAMTAAKAKIEEAHRATENAHSAERDRLEEAVRASEGRLGAATAAKAQIEQAQRTSEEAYSAEIERLEESLRASEDRLAAVSVVNAEIEETLRTKEERYAAGIRQLEEGLRASHKEEKLQALGQFAGGVAHGLNNFLTVINGYTDLLLGKIPRTNPLSESVAQIKKAGEKAMDLVAPLLAFSQGQVLWAKVLDVNEVVKEAEKSLRGKLGEEIRLSTVLSPTLGPVKADPEQLQHVLTNLATNAREAMRSGGSLVIETQNADLDESYAAKYPGVKPGPYVHLTVSDTGTGMSEETQGRLFEPFYTTKPPGQGLGLGLASVYGIVRQSGGSIRVESELAKGATVHVYLPRIGETVTLTGGEKPTLSTMRGTETVLVVDDQEEIRKLAQVVLKSNGYKVAVAGNGWEALLYSERHAGPIHLMLTDIKMPGMTGQELAERLRPLRPEMAVVFMSGYLESRAARSGDLQTGAGFLSKPFSPDALATKVREALGPPRSAGKVLVIEDETGIRSFLRMILASVGYEVLEADSAEQALKNLNGEVVELILVNLGVPSQYNVEKIRLLQKRHPNLKVIAMAEAYGNEFLRAAEQLGAQATLAKPIRADQLLETLRRTSSEW